MPFFLSASSKGKTSILTPIFSFDIGENVIYANKKYEITEVFDEMIKIKGINEENENNNLIFKVKGFKEKNQKGKNKEKECLWVEKDNYKLKIIE